ncbi:hypothetical protein [Pleionea sediminis]|uniref:hypothetical protein n=1 Tax=Pleionea sediminis TaxID=2569479 RepID=UPI0011864F14|nr:hypothetical protein [Pleionea sediminis]
MSEIDGLKALSKKLSELGSQLGGKTLRQSLLRASTPTVKQIKQNLAHGKSPHKTYKGRLVAPGFARRNVARKSKLSRDKTTAFVFIGVKPEAYYAVAFLELGTRFIPANPVFTRALEQDQSNIVARFSELLKDKIDTIGQSS